MDVRHTHMIEKLSEHGWRVVHREREELDWWADEIWSVESVWSPQCFTIYLTWLVDPQWGYHRQPGQGVWGIGTSLQWPALCEEAEGKPLMSIKHWPRDLAEFLAALSELRNLSL